MALEDELISQPAADALVKWEEYVSNGVGEIFAGAVAQFGYSAQALLTSQISVKEFIGSTLAQVFNVGTAIAAGAAQIISGRRPTVVRRGLNVRELPPTPAVTYAQKVDYTVAEAVASLAQRPDESQTIVERVRDNVRAIGTAEVNSTAARASEVTARSLGAPGVVWVAERDACVNCAALAGQVARPDPREPHSSRTRHARRPRRLQERPGFAL